MFGYLANSYLGTSQQCTMYAIFSGFVNEDLDLAVVLVANPFSISRHFRHSNLISLLC